jgi:hypothetical protein
MTVPLLEIVLEGTVSVRRLIVNFNVPNLKVWMLWLRASLLHHSAQEHWTFAVPAQAQVLPSPVHYMDTEDNVNPVEILAQAEVEAEVEQR